MKTPPSSPLGQVRMPPDSCVLEVFFVHVAFGDPEVNGQLWDGIDEQQLPAELRHCLGRNGFRVGLVGGQMPTQLSKLLELGDKPPPMGKAAEVTINELGSEPRVSRCHLSIGRGQRKEIVVSGIYDELPVLLCEQGRVGGETYPKAQGILAVTTTPLEDGRVAVELVPELQYGEPRQQWIGDQGVLRLDAGRSRRQFRELAFSATLSPGNMLILGSLPQLPGSLGHHLFTVDDGRLQQKLVILRLSQTQHDGLFTPPEVLDLKE